MRIILAVAALAALGACATAAPKPAQVATAAAAPAEAAKAKPKKVKCRVESSGLGSNMKTKQCATPEQNADKGDKDNSREEVRRFQRALDGDVNEAANVN